MKRTACALFLTILGSALSLADTLRDAPAKTTSLTNPYAHDSGAVRAGGKLFRYHCAECHGGDANGSRFAPTLRSRSVQGADAGALFWFLTNGDLKRGMPSWSRLPEQRRWQLVSYLKLLGDNTRAVTPATTRASTPPEYIRLDKYEPGTYPIHHIRERECEERP
jgi:mono/diheme cytochrome c family protein